MVQPAGLNPKAGQIKSVVRTGRSSLVLAVDAPQGEAARNLPAHALAGAVSLSIGTPAHPQRPQRAPIYSASYSRIRLPLKHFEEILFSKVLR
jgi:hypothetical protein